MTEDQPNMHNEFTILKKYISIVCVSDLNQCLIMVTSYKMMLKCHVIAFIFLFKCFSISSLSINLQLNLVVFQ